MPTFKMTSPQGQTFDVTAPDATTALRVFRKHFGQKKQDISTGEDIARSFGRGAAKGALAIGTLPGTARELGFAAAAKGAEFFGASPETVQGIRDVESTMQSALPPMLGGGPSFSDAEKELASLGFRFSKPQTTSGEFAQTIGEFLPGALAPGTIPVKIAQVIAPAVTSETAGQLTKGTILEPFARLAGAILGGAGIAGAQRAVSPSAAPTANQAADIARLEQSGVKSITAGQRANDARLIKREALSSETFAGQALERQLDEFTEATLNLAGIQGNRARQDIIQSAAETIGARFDRMQELTRVPITKEMATEARNIVASALGRMSEGRMPPVIRNISERLLRGGTMTGEGYKKARSELSAIVRNNKNSEVSNAASDLISVMDDSAEAWLMANRPELVGEWDAVRSQFQNLLVIEKAASFAGKDAARGIITPARLQSAVKAVQGPRALTRGRTPAGELSRAGVAVLDRPPTSGTPEGMRALGLGKSFAAIPGDVARRFSVSRPGQARLSSQAFPRSSLGGFGGIGRSALAGALVDPN